MVSSDLRRALKGTGAPTAVLDLDAFDANLDALAERARGLPIRLATKSLRVPAAIDRALAHPAFSGVLAFSVPEALFLHARGVRDIVIGYPSLDRAALSRMFAEAGACTNITLMIDSVDHLDIIDDVRENLAEAGRRSSSDGTGPAGEGKGLVEAGAASVRVCIDVDSSYRPAESWLGDRLHIGARRSPIRAGRAAIALARQVAARPGFDLVGMMFYEGQIAGTADAGHSVRQTIVRAIQKASIVELAERRAAVIAAVREVADLEFVNGGGTGSFESSSVEGTLTELAAGSGLFSPGLFDGYTHFRHRPAAYFVTPVVRRPAPGWVTVFKGGFIASGVPGSDRLPTIAWPPGLEYSGLEGPGEVQTPLTGPGTEVLRIGDLVWFRHAKAGELAEHFNEFLVVSGSTIIDTWSTYRGEGLVL
ncbi:D-serine deaminase, pyridoxal phosphate-dependent [Brevibacterium iodinum ATCC 49514]|uniref:D-serine deaminase, pyridoxal phosphate-dependent n=1 Tax=Brevibacterium iodinum ATCC 49514 TaxID=1255616 RepID=A0A2H1K636_9MICO|nr:amino acid deaminase/aldolase [Brevibacterium iodinum]SMX95119.1 D-serine deaminase, pyridoxal phosphate-dependent [Brevibacterium iodinum ATCC 49514]